MFLQHSPCRHVAQGESYCLGSFSAGTQTSESAEEKSHGANWWHSAFVATCSIKVRTVISIELCSSWQCSFLFPVRDILSSALASLSSTTIFILCRWSGTPTTTHTTSQRKWNKLRSKVILASNKPAILSVSTHTYSLKWNSLYQCQACICSYIYKWCPILTL